MLRHKNILVAVDGSEASFKALSESIQLARWSKGRVTAIVIVPSYEGDLSLVGVKSIKSAIHGPCEKILNRTMDIAETWDVQIHAVCEQGKMHEELSKRAESEGIDLIILGVSGKSSLLRIFFRDTVSILPEISRKDLLVIPDQAVIGWSKTLFVTTEEDCGSKVSDRAIELAASYGSSMIILGIAQGRPFARMSTSLPVKEKPLELDIRQYMSRVQARAKQAGVECESVLRRGCALETINNIVKKESIDLIVTGANGRTGLKGLWAGLSLERLVYGSSCPVFIPAQD
jgi:nucleotide-binding universal stress UspA family protein